MTEPIPSAPEHGNRKGRAVAGAFFLLLVLAAGSWFFGRGSGAAPSVATRSVPVNGTRLFDQVASAVAFRYVDSLDASLIYEKAVSGLLRELNDPYSSYLSSERLARLDEQMTGVYAGVGLQFDYRDGVLVVLEPLPGSPAEKAGLQAGDRLMSVNGESTRGWSYTEASRVIRGKPGTSVDVIVERGGQRLPFALLREEVHVRAVSRVAVLPNGVGYIDLNVFGQSTTRELEAAIDSVVRIGAEALVIDLRGNPGGLLEQGVAVAELFLDPGQVVVQLRGRPGEAIHNYADSSVQRWPSMPLSILIDKGSASASEIVAGALQDHDRAIVVGVTSFGKGSAQSVFPLADGGGLRLTTARWYTPLGRSINRLSDVAALNNDDPDEVPRKTVRDTVKPAFRTDAGRVVYGGGGIIPDIHMGDTVTPTPILTLARAMGPHFGEYREAITRLAKSLHASGAVHSWDEPVTPQMLEALYKDLEARQVAPALSTYEAASPWISRSLGYEMARVAFGADAEFQRRALEDLALQRAASLLSGARTPKEVFARAEQSLQFETAAAPAAAPVDNQEPPR